jgi:ribosome-binding protein aMBF1 (putative translation factor)
VGGRQGPKKTRRSEDRIEVRVLVKVLRQAREEAGYSARRLSLELGKVGSFIGKIEGGHHLPDFITIMDIAKIVGVSPVEIMSRVVTLLEAQE